MCITQSQIFPAWPGGPTRQDFLCFCYPRARCQATKDPRIALRPPKLFNWPVLGCSTCLPFLQKPQDRTWPTLSLCPCALLCTPRASPLWPCRPATSCLWDLWVCLSEPLLWLKLTDHLIKEYKHYLKSILLYIIYILYMLIVTITYFMFYIISFISVNIFCSYCSCLS